MIKIDYHIYEIRTEKKMTLRDLSSVSGVSRSQIDRIENNQTHPTVLTLCQIADALEANPCDLFSYYIK